MKLLMNLRPTIAIDKGTSRHYRLVMILMFLVGGVGILWTAHDWIRVTWRHRTTLAALESAKAILPLRKIHCKKLTTSKKIQDAAVSMLAMVGPEMRHHHQPMTSLVLRTIETGLPNAVSLHSMEWYYPTKHGYPKLIVFANAPSVASITAAINSLSSSPPLKEGKLLNYNHDKFGWTFKAVFSLSSMKEGDAN